MKFINPSTDNLGELSDIEDRFEGIWEKQSDIWRYMPLVFAGSSWSGKDTVLNAVTGILKEKFWVVVSPTRARYITRERRAGEEGSPLNFVSEEEFKKRDFSYSYKYANNFYGLDMDELNTELQKWNTSLVNGSPYSLQGLFDVLFSQVIKWSMPPLILFMFMDIDDSARLIEKRWWDQADMRKRKNSLGWSWDRVRYFQRLSRYKHYIKTVSRSPQINSNENQHYFNHDVLTSLNTILNHISKYLNMSPNEIKAERVDFRRQHFDNRP